MYKALFNTKKSAAEHVSTLRKLWLCSKDIMDLLGCGKTTACKVIQEIQQEEIKRGLSPIPRYVSREAFLRWQGRTLDDYINDAKIEAELKQININGNK